VSQADASFLVHRDLLADTRYCEPIRILPDLNAIKFNGQSLGVAEKALNGLLGGLAEEKRALAEKASPVTDVTKDDAPFLIIHGDTDDLVPQEQSRRLGSRWHGIPLRCASDQTHHQGQIYRERVLRDSGINSGRNLLERRHRLASNGSWVRPEEVVHRVGRLSSAKSPPEGRLSAR
jgi:hypothetical protein